LNFKLGLQLFIDGLFKKQAKVSEESKVRLSPSDNFSAYHLFMAIEKGF